MSGGPTILSPSDVCTTLIQDGQAANSITAADDRQVFASAIGLLPITQSGTTHTFALIDWGTIQDSTNAAATTFTIPPHSSVAFNVGCFLYGRQCGAGSLSFAAGAGVTFHQTASLTTRVQWATIIAHQRSVDEWVITGDLA